MRTFGLALIMALLASSTALAAGKAKPKKKPAPAAPAKAAPAKAAEPPHAVEGAVPVGAAPAPPPEAASAPTPKGPTRIDFDDRLVEGQTNKSGAVYLYDRKDLQVESMVKQPSTYREEISRGLLQ